jgi:hypothetical protein
MKVSLATIAAVVAIQGGCTSSVTPPDRTHGSGDVISSLASAGAIGYQHTIERSKFALGSGVAARDEFGMHKIVGDQGVFATRASGMVTAITNGDSTARQGIPIGDDKLHNDAVRRYFVASGIPEDQIAAVQDFQVVRAPASGDQPDDPSKRTVMYRYSMLKRSIQGIVVADSFAWARMNVDGAVVEEQVYWPSIPGSVIDSALEFSAKLKDEAVLVAFEAQLPPHRTPSGVVIRHSPGEWDGTFFADAYVDVVQDQPSFPATLHATRTGVVVQLPWELEGAWGPEASSGRKAR